MTADPHRSSPVGIESPTQWEALLGDLPGPHLLQSSAWGAFKSRYGWTAERLAWLDDARRPVAAAQILRRRWPDRGGFPGLSLLYCPRGPVLDWQNDRLVEDVLTGLTRLTVPARTVLIQIEPDAPWSDQTASRFRGGGWLPSPQPVQFGSTMVLDLTQTEDDLLAAMKPKTRYNIRLAARRGVAVRRGTEADFDRLYALYAETSVRDGFVIRPADYYRHAWGDFLRAGMAQPFLAEVEGQAVAGLILFHYGGRAWFFYGMSSAAHRERMPNHALQWEAIRWARGAGCHTYDLWGAPEASDPSDPLWGVQRFKEGFGARHVKLAGSWDHTRRPRLYRAYTLGLPRLLGWMRRRQEARTRRMLEPGG